MSFIPTKKSEFRPRIISSDSSHMRQELAASVLPKGASLAVPSSFHQRTASGYFGGNMPMGVSPQSGGGGGSGMYHMQRPYMPGIESPDRIQYPKTREEANRAWRLFHETDPIFGTAIDMYAEMLVSDFDIVVGDDKSVEIRDTLEYMCQVTNFMDRLRYIVREYLVVGESIPHCWTPEQRVPTPQGFKRIDSLKVGDQVLTHGRRFMPISEIYRRPYEGDVINLNIYGISALPCRCTPEHPVYVWTETGPEWKRADELTIKDHIAVGIIEGVEDVEDFDISDVVPEYFDLLVENEKHAGYSGRDVVPSIVKVDEDFMRLVGFYYSEGNAVLTPRKGRVSFSFHIDETSYREDVLRVVKDKFGIEGRVQRYEQGHTGVVHVDSKIVAKFFLNLFGTGFCDKLVPEWLYKLPLDKQRGFLAGLFRGDGNIYLNKKTTFTTAQVQLGHEGVTHLAWQMLLRRGIAASFNMFNRAKYGTYWKCAFNAGMYPEFAKEIFEVDVKPANVFRKPARLSHEHLFYRVRSIKREPYSGEVFNLEVPEDHSYVVGGIVGHNCFFDENLGIWTYIALHNPDFIEVVDSPIVNMDPIISFIPDESLRSMMSSGTPEAREFRSRLPADFVSRILARQKIRLSPLNCTFIPRKLHPYQTRGTSLASRMWRIFMVEDAVYNSTISTFRRSAAPLKVLKLGDPQSGWIPAPGTENKLLEMLNRAETDPQCFVPETLITRRDGTQVPIGDLEVGDELLDRHGAPCRVEVLQEETTEELIELSVTGTTLLKCTPRHKWDIWGAPRHYCKDNRAPSAVRRYAIKRGWNPYQKVEASEILPGDYLLIPRKFEESSYEGVTLERAKLLGYYVAEGYTRLHSPKAKSRHGFALSFSLKELETHVSECVGIIENLCGSTPILRVREDICSCEVLATRSVFDDLARWLEHHGGRGSHTKKLSLDVMGWPLHLKREFLKGYFAGDGSCSEMNGNPENRYISVASTSLNLMNQVKLILAQLGTYASLQTKVNPEGSFSTGNVYYRLDFFGKTAAEFSWDVWGLSASANGTHSASWWSDDDYIYVRVRGVNRVSLDKPQVVVNMTVSGDHSYLTNCIGTRNSWLIYHYGINFEQWGDPGRAITIGKEHDIIERVKLLALGLSKSFMTGEVTYASSNDTIVRTDSEGYKKIEEINIGDRVKDRFGSTKTVTDVFKYPSPDQMVEITVYGNRKLKLTDNHFLPVFMRPRVCLCGCGQLLGEERYVAQGHMYWRSFVPGHHKLSERGGRDRVWSEYKFGERVIARFPEKHDPYQKLMAAEVIKGDWLMIPRKFDVSETPATPENLTKALLLGYYAAEGCISDENSRTGTKSVLFTFGHVSKEEYYANDVVRLMADLGYDIKWRYKSETDLCHIVRSATQATPINDWLDSSVSRYSHLLNLSSEVMHWNLDLKKEFIKGLFRGDGYLFKGGNGKTNKNRLDIVYVTASEQLAMQIELILAQLGYPCSIHVSEPRVDKKGYHHKSYWYVSIYGKKAKSLAELVWSDVPPVWDRVSFEGFDATSQGDRSQVFLDEDYLYLPVEEVKIIDVDKTLHPYVYSLSVEGTESYTLDNIASYNSAKSGLQVFLRRLLSLRQLMENIWIYPKYFRPISEINEWTTSSKSEINHKYRIKRTAQEIQEQNLVMVPTLKWKNKLDPTVDTDILAAYQILEKFGIKLSKSTISSSVGVDWKDELDRSLKEFKTENELKEGTLGKTELAAYEQEYGKGDQQPAPGAPGAPGSGAKPPAATGKPPGGMAAPGGAPGGGMNDASKPPGSAEPTMPGALSDGIEAPSGGGLPG